MSDINLTKKQTIAWQYLMDDPTKEVLFGSGAGSGKSFLGCLWVTTMCLKYPGVRYLIGRSVLTQLRLTTLRTLLETFKVMGLISEEHFNYNQQTNVIKFYNESEIILKDMASTPGDPQMDSLGSLELTGAFLDEMTQISQMAYHIIKSRIRFKLNEYKITGKLFMSCNPGQTFLKSEFYLPFIEDRLEPHKKFVMATALDNHYLPKQYIETLMNLPEQQKQRLLLGNWDYTQDINAIFEYDSIAHSSFALEPNRDDKVYLSCDVSRFGEDRSVVVVWVGKVIVEIYVYRKLSTTELTLKIQELMKIYKVPPGQVVIDSDGIGSGVADQVRGQNFVNNAKPFHNENYANLKSQCYFKLSELFKKREISINILDSAVVEELTQELLSVKLKDVDKDNKIQVISKDEQKKILGRSPDISDAVAMGMYFVAKQYKNSGKYNISFI